MNAKDSLRELPWESVSEKAPEGLIQKVMSRIEIEPLTTIYRAPLIPLKAWVLIGAGLIFLCLQALFWNDVADEKAGILTPVSQWLENISFQLPEFYTVPDALWIGMLAFGFFGWLQLYWMKSRLSRQGL